MRMAWEGKRKTGNGPQSQMPPAQPSIAGARVRQSTGVQRLERLARGPVFENLGRSLVDWSPQGLADDSYRAWLCRSRTLCPRSSASGGVDDAAPKSDVVGQA